MGKGEFVFKLANSEFFSQQLLLRALQDAKKRERPSKQELYVAFGPEDMGVGLVLKVPRHPEWALVLPTDPVNMSLECTFTLGIVSRGHIWAYIRDVLTIICQGVPLAFEFRYEDVEETAAEYGWFDFKEDKFLVRRVLAGEGAEAEPVLGIGGATVVGTGGQGKPEPNQNGLSLHAVYSSSMCAARATLLPPPPSDTPEDERNVHSAEQEASVIAGTVRQAPSCQPPSPAAVTAATAVTASPQASPGCATPAASLRGSQATHVRTASTADILSWLPPPKASILGSPVLHQPVAKQAIKQVNIQQPYVASSPVAGIPAASPRPSIEQGTPLISQRAAAGSNPHSDRSHGVLAGDASLLKGAPPAASTHTQSYAPAGLALPHSVQMVTAARSAGDPCQYVDRTGLETQAPEPSASAVYSAAAPAQQAQRFQPVQDSHNQRPFTQPSTNHVPSTSLVAAAGGKTGQSGDASPMQPTACSTGPLHPGHPSLATDTSVASCNKNRTTPTPSFPQPSEMAPPQRLATGAHHKNPATPTTPAITPATQQSVTPAPPKPDHIPPPLALHLIPRASRPPADRATSASSNTNSLAAMRAQLFSARSTSTTASGRVLSPASVTRAIPAVPAASSLSAPPSITATASPPNSSSAVSLSSTPGSIRDPGHLTTCTPTATASSRAVAGHAGL